MVHSSVLGLIQYESYYITHCPCLRLYFSDRSVFSSTDDIIDDNECNHVSIDYLMDKHNINDPTDGLEDAHIDDTLDNLANDPADDPVDNTDDDSKQKGAFIR